MVNEWEVKTWHRLLVERSDGGLEYTGKQRPEWFQAKRVVNQTSTRYTTKQNGLAERYNCTVI